MFFSYPEIIGNYDVEYSAGGAGQNTARALTVCIFKILATIYSLKLISFSSG